VRRKRNEAVEARRERFQVLSRQTGDQVDVKVRVGLRAQPAQIGRGRRVVLAARDRVLDVDIEGLDSDLELQRPGGKTRDQRLQPLRQVVRNQFEVQERRILRMLADQAEKELEDRRCGGTRDERTVDELNCRPPRSYSRCSSAAAAAAGNPMRCSERGQAELA
jgi:hypothetical protein